MISTILMMLQAAAPAPAAAVATPPAPWAVRETKAATGSSAVSAAAIARDGSSRMVIRCDRAEEQVVSIQFIAKQPLAVAEKDVFAEKPVSLRFDGGPAIEYNWEFTANAAFIRDSASVTALAVELAKAREVKVSTTNAAKFGFEGTFQGPSGDASINTVLTACGYVLGEVPVLKPAAKK